MNPFEDPKISSQQESSSKLQQLRSMPEPDVWRARILPEDVEEEMPNMANIWREVNKNSRQPSIENHWFDKVSYSELEKQWGLIMQAALVELKNSETVRNAVKKFIQTPLAEDLGDVFLDELQECSPRLEKLRQRYANTLGDFLSKPPVPKNVISPDLRSAPTREKIENRIIMQAKGYFCQSEEEVIKEIRQSLQRGRFDLITPEEGAMVMLRFKFARDVKLLALAAYMQDQESLVSVVDEQEGLETIDLGAGIKIVADTEQLNHSEAAKILNPINWEGRKQIKDRIWEILVSGKKYILKEKKTSRHRDTIKGGHKEGLNSYQEFLTARDFTKNGKQQEGMVNVDWEKPIGTVSFEDGYQFTIYELHEDVVHENNKMSLPDEIRAALLERFEEFSEEYEVVARLSESYLLDPRLKNIYFDNERGETSTERLLSLIKGKRALTPEQFINAKARFLEDRARELLDRTISEFGYSNHDQDGYAYRLIKEPKLTLRIIGFDFEYYFPIPSRGLEDFYKLNYSFEATHDNKPYAISGVSRLEMAAYLVLRDLNKAIRRGYPANKAIES